MYQFVNNINVIIGSYSSLASKLDSLGLPIPKLLIPADKNLLPITDMTVTYTTLPSETSLVTRMFSPYFYDVVYDKENIQTDYYINDQHLMTEFTFAFWIFGGGDHYNTDLIFYFTSSEYIQFNVWNVV